MALTYHPPPGAVLVCDYSTGFRVPEMVKRRLAVIITPRLRRRDGLCTVVPLSLTAPRPAKPYHHLVTFQRPLPQPWGGTERWVKGDMLATVGFGRLTPIGVGRDAAGKRRYVTPHLTDDDLGAVRRCVLHALNMSHLTKFL